MKRSNLWAARTLAEYRLMLYLNSWVHHWMCNMALIADKPNPPLFDPLTGTRSCLEANWRVSFLLFSWSAQHSPLLLQKLRFFFAFFPPTFFFKTNILRFLSLSSKSYEGILEGLCGINLKRKRLSLLLFSWPFWLIGSVCKELGSAFDLHQPPPPLPAQSFSSELRLKSKKKKKGGKDLFIFLQKRIWGSHGVVLITVVLCVCLVLKIAGQRCPFRWTCTEEEDSWCSGSFSERLLRSSQEVGV